MANNGGTRTISRKRIERAAMCYRSNKDAGLAIGITPQAFGKLCRKFEVETPQARRERTTTKTA